MNDPLQIDVTIHDLDEAAQTARVTVKTHSLEMNLFTEDGGLTWIEKNSDTFVPIDARVREAIQQAIREKVIARNRKR